MSDRHQAELTKPDGAEPGTVREYRMRVTDAWVAGGAQHVHLVAVDDPAVCVDTTFHDPSQYLDVEQQCMITVHVGPAIPDGS